MEKEGFITVMEPVDVRAQLWKHVLAVPQDEWCDWEQVVDQW